METSALLNLLSAVRAGRMRPADVLRQVVDESTDPVLASMVGTMMSEHAEADVVSKEDAAATLVDEQRRREREVDELATTLRDAQGEIARVSGELAQLSRRNEELAAALGACPQCWGTDDACDVCAGHGRPGSAPPVREDFDRYVSPVLRRLRPAARPTPKTGGVPPNR